MELTKDYFIEHGYLSNHPDYVLCKFYKTNNAVPEWRITVEQDYIPLSNKLAFNITCWLCDEKGAIIKRTSIHMANTVEELESVIKLCRIIE